MSIEGTTALEAMRRLFRAVFPNRAVLIVFLMAFVAYGYFFHRFRFWNVNSRLALTYAIVDDHALCIDKYVNHPYYETQDRAFFRGHYYSDKIIGLSLLATPVYWVMENAFALVGKDPKPDLSRYGLTVCTVSLASALMLTVLVRFLVLLGLALDTACMVILFFAFGTMLFPFSSLFYAYLPSLFFLMAAWYLMVRDRVSPPERRCPAWILGGLVGTALLCEYTLAVPAMFISAYYLATLRERRNVIPYAAAACAVLLIFAAYNWVCFGNPLSLAYLHLENPEFREGMGNGLMGIGRFQWYVLWLITLHPYRGVFFYSPFLLLAFVGLARALFGKAAAAHDERRPIALIILATVAYYLVLNASYYMWWGGGTILARHLVPMLPFLALSFAWLPRRLKPVLAVLGILSVVLMFPQSVVEPHFLPPQGDEGLYSPWDTVRTTGRGLTPPFLQHSLPEFLQGRISMNPFNRAIHATDGKALTLLPLLIVEIGLFLWLRRTVRNPNCQP